MPERIVATVVACFKTPAVVGETLDDEHGIRAGSSTLVAVANLIPIRADLFGIASQHDVLFHSGQLLFLLPQCFVGLPETFHLGADGVAIADPITTVADGIYG